MAENDEFSLLAFERSEVDAAQVIVFGVREVAGPKQEMVAVRKKHGEAVGLILLGSDAKGNGRYSCPVGIDPLERTLGIGGKNNYTFAAPSTAASGQGGGEDLRRPARDRS